MRENINIIRKFSDTMSQIIPEVRILTRAGTKLGDKLRLKVSAGEVSQRWNQIYPSIFTTYSRILSIDVKQNKDFYYTKR